MVLRHNCLCVGHSPSVFSVLRSLELALCRSQPYSITRASVAQDTASANAILRSLELALRGSQQHVLYFGHWSRQVTAGSHQLGHVNDSQDVPRATRRQQ